LFLAVNAEDLSREYIADAGASALAMAWPAFQWLALGMLPIVTAPTIPADRQYGVDELLRSTPLTGSIYLAGKVLGVIAAMLLTGAAALTLHLVLHFAFIGPINSGLYAELILLNGLPCCCGLGDGNLGGVCLAHAARRYLHGHLRWDYRPFPLGFGLPVNL
jgi:hypothetical protein